ncbi:MAG: energy transducer TonB [Deltaproteobacteria bacterium]|nr:energy transducer TonB [Deltaproteobacteria bacterium]MBN2673216.1 energy transducer TonB [Deltaproteobacteria bacterium]
MTAAAAKESFRRPLFFFLLAALAHLLIGLPLLSVLLQSSDTDSGNGRMEVDLWPSTFANSQKPQAEEDINDDKTVVDVGDNSTGKSSSKSAKYYSRGGSSVDRETRARNIGKHRVDSPAPLEQTSPAIQSEPESLPSSPPPLTEPSDVILPQDPTPTLPQKTTPLQLKPNETAFESAVSGSGLADLRDVMEGEQTALNSVSFRHAPFFNRVQKMVEQYWHPDVAIRRNDPETKIIGSKDRVTTLLVVLNRDGSLHKVYTMHPSGALFLDDEASDAVKNAAPFPNVPSGLVNEADGMVKFLFQFTVEINRKPAIRVRRYE